VGLTAVEHYGALFFSSSRHWPCMMIRWWRQWPSRRYLIGGLSVEKPTVPDVTTGRVKRKFRVILNGVPYFLCLHQSVGSYIRRKVKGAHIGNGLVFFWQVWWRALFPQHLECWRALWGMWSVVFCTSVRACWCGCGECMATSLGMNSSGIVYVRLRRPLSRIYSTRGGSTRRGMGFGTSTYRRGYARKPLILKRPWTPVTRRQEVGYWPRRWK
jgi:hypothetical protein